jgi:hypothetical protein
MDKKAADLLSLEFIHEALHKVMLTAGIAQGQCELGDKEGLHRTLKQLIACAREATGEYKEVLAREALEPRRPSSDPASRGHLLP